MSEVPLWEGVVIISKEVYEIEVPDTGGRAVQGILVTREVSYDHQDIVALKSEGAIPRKAPAMAYQ